MSLRNVKNFQQEVRQNNGVLKTDQIELVGTTTVPTTNLSDGRIYYNSSSDILYARIGSSWKDLAAVGTGSVSGWNSIYDLSKTMEIDSTAVTWTLTHATNDGLVLAASNAVTSSTSAILQFANSGSNLDVQGTGDTWNITSAGVIVATGLTMADSETITLGDSSDATIEWNGTLLNIAGATDFDDAVTMQSTITIAGTAGSDSITLTAGDVVVSDGSLTLTDADNAATVVIVNATATTGADQVTMTFAELTTKNALAITADKITEGAMVYLDNGGASMTTGAFIWCGDDTVADFKVGADGATTITGAVNSSVGLTVVGVQTAENTVAITSSGATATGQASLLLNPSGNIADNGTILRIAPSGTPVAGSQSIAIVGTGKDIQAINSDTDNTDEHAVQITGTGTLNAASMLYVANDATPTGASDTLVHFASTVDGVSQGIILKLDGTDTVTTALSVDTDCITTNAVEITGSGALNAGNMLYIANDATPNAAGDALVQITSTVVGPSQGILLDLLGTTYEAVTALNIDVDNVAVHAVSIDGSGALAAGNMLKVDNDGTPAANTDAIAHITFTGTATNNPIVLEVDNSTKDACPLLVTSNVAAATRSVGEFIQDSTTGAISVVSLKQDDVSEPWIEFVATTVGANNSISITDKSAAGTAYYVKVLIGTSPMWVQAYDSDGA